MKRKFKFTEIQGESGRLWGGLCPPALPAPWQGSAAEARPTWGGELGGFGKATVVLIVRVGELLETGGHHFFGWWG